MCLIAVAGFLTLIAEPGIGLRKLRLRRLRFLLLNQRLKMLDDLLAFVESRRPVGHPDGLGEAGVPIGRVETQSRVEQLVSLHREYALLPDVLDRSTLFQIGLA